MERRKEYHKMKKKKQDPLVSFDLCRAPPSKSLSSARRLRLLVLPFYLYKPITHVVTSFHESYTENAKQRCRARIRKKETRKLFDFSHSLRNEKTCKLLWKKEKTDSMAPVFSETVSSSYFDLRREEMVAFDCPGWARRENQPEGGIYTSLYKSTRFYLAP